MESHVHHLKIFFVLFLFSSGKAGISPKRQDIQVLGDKRFLLLDNIEFLDLSLNVHFEDFQSVIQKVIFW